MRTLATCVMILCLLSITPAKAQDSIFSRFNPFSQRGAETVEDAAPLDDGAAEPFSPLESESAFETEAGDLSSGLRFPTLTPPTLPKLNLPKPQLPTMPKLELPRLGMPERQPNRSSTPSAWQRFNEGTKSFFARTRSALMPWAEKDKEPGPSTPSMRIGSRPRRNGSRSSTLMDSFFSGSSEPEPTESVNDYLQLPRPTY